MPATGSVKDLALALKARIIDPPCRLFFLPTQGVEAPHSQDILNRLNSYYNPSPLPPWSLTHRLFREMPTGPQTTLEKGKATGQRYLQILALSHHAPQTHIAITTTNAPAQTRAGTPASSNVSAGAESISGEPATIISIPSGLATEDFIQLAVMKLGASWQQRQTLNVVHGHALEVGDFRIRVGDVRQGSGGGAQNGRGTVVEVQWVGSEEGEEDWESAEAVIGSFWDGLGVRGARKVFWVPGLAEGEGSVRQWCDILRIRT